jgi:PPOX class probable F420-dependent enzyme
VVWLKRDGDDVLFSTTKQRQKGRNLARDPRVSIVVVDPDDPYNFAEIRGRADLTDDPDNALGNALTQEYLGTDAPPDAPGGRAHRRPGDARQGDRPGPPPVVRMLAGWAR